MGQNFKGVPVVTLSVDVDSPGLIYLKIPGLTDRTYWNLSKSERWGLWNLTFGFY